MAEKTTKTQEQREIELLASLAEFVLGYSATHAPGAPASPAPASER